jgi:nucleotide sugar dehydrogenase
MITDRPSRSASLVGGSITLPEQPCVHEPARPAAPWTGEPGTAGTVTVVGAGKMGLPLAVQFASHGWSVIAVDVNPDVVAAINAGRSHVAEEPGLAERVAAEHAAGRLRATTDGAAAARESDVVVLIVPVMLDDAQQPDYRYMDAASAAIAPGVRAGATVIFETTLPVGDTRGRYVPRLEAATGLVAERDFFVAFSPERLFTGAVFRNLATYPKLVGGIGPASTDRAARFYASVLDAEVVAMSSAEAAEMSKLADTTYRDLNIAFANELARYADRIGVDVLEVIRAANSQPYSHIHQPGLGVGGHCIPVYPHFLLSRAPEMELVALARRVNDGQVGVAVEVLRAALGTLEGVPVLVLGLTYREGVKELAYSRAITLIEELATAGARVSAWDPLLAADEVAALGATPWAWGTPSDAVAIVAQTADAAFRELDPAWLPRLRAVLDGRNGLADMVWPAGVAVHGIGVPVRDAREVASPAHPEPAG